MFGRLLKSNRAISGLHFRLFRDFMLPVEIIERSILFIHGRKVMLDRDLADLYGVPTKRLNEQVRRNIKRFPSDFMFRLTPDEER